jgi:hypothetical protein
MATFDDRKCTMRRYDLLDEFTSLCVPAQAPARPSLPTTPRSRRWIAPVAVAAAGFLLLVI